MTPPEAWKKASAERFTRLGALVTRREILTAEAAEVSRQIGELQREILAIERTGGLAAEVERAAAEKTAPNGHEPDRAPGPGS